MSQGGPVIRTVSAREGEDTGHHARASRMQRGGQETVVGRGPESQEEGSLGTSPAAPDPTLGASGPGREEMHCLRPRLRYSVTAARGMDTVPVTRFTAAVSEPGTSQGAVTLVDVSLKSRFKSAPLQMC